MLDGGGPACSRPIRVPTTMLMNIVLVRKQNKTKKQKINNTCTRQQLHLQKNIHPPLHSLYYLSISMHRGKSSSPPYPHASVPPRDTTHVREDHARRNSDAVKLRGTTAKKEKKKKTTNDDDDMQVPACLFSVAVLSLCPDRAGIIFSSTRPSPIM